MKKLRVLIADDHQVVRRGVAAMLSDLPEMEICGEASDGRQAVEIAARCKPDIVIMDIGMPEMNGIEATRHILKDHPGTQVLILTMHESEELLRNLLNAGARGYVLKSDIAENLGTAVRALAKHEVFMTPRVAEVVVQSYLKMSDDTAGAAHSHDLISPREREIVQLVAEGKSNKEIANVLSISVKTVETHRAHLMAKLNLHSVSDLIRYAIRNHIIET